MGKNKAFPSSIPLDMGQFNTITEGKNTYQEELLELFFFNSAECLVVMGRNLSMETGQKWQDATSELKNLSNSIGALELYKACAVAEKMVDASEEEKSKMLASIKIHIQRLRAFVRNTRY